MFHTVYLVSDGTCRTCEQVVRAVLVQFEPVDVQLVKKTNVRRRETVESLVQKAAQDQAIVFYTLVSEEVRHAMHEAAIQYLVPTVDLLGPVLHGLYELFHSAPQAQPGILYASNRAHFDRIDAVEYTLNHDDGCALHELGDADVVLVGVSRTSKSTTCFYLGYSGVRAANVPLFADAEPPAELLKVDPRRVVGLTANPYRLQSVRQARLRGWGMTQRDEYADLLQITRELRAATEQMSKYGWRCIDVSYKAIEEIAREVRQMLEEAGAAIGERPGPEP